MTSEKNPLEIFTRDETLRLRAKHIGKSCALFFEESPLKIVKGSGVYLFDEENRKYLDCINNVAHVGHCHPAITEACVNQMQLLYTNSRYLHDQIVLYAKRLTSYLPSQLSVCYFVNSGSEANDLALRLARTHTKKKDFIVLDGAYHGNLSSTTDLSPLKFEKLPNGKKKFVHVASLPCSYRGKYNLENCSSTEIGSKYADDLKVIINNAHNEGREIAAFIAESMVSCGGQIVLPDGYLKAVYRFVREAGGVCIADEVQTGFARTGLKWWAFELQDVCPDILTIGKPIANGFPVAAVVTTEEISQSFKNTGISYFNTFGGNPVSMAIANAVLDVIENEKLKENATTVGNYLLKELHKLKEKHFLIGDIRGVGLFLGIDLVKDRKTKEPASEEAALIVSRLKEKFIILTTEGKHENVLKFKPPMVFSVECADKLLNALEILLTEIESQPMVNGFSGYESSSESLSVSEGTTTDDEISSSVLSSCNISLTPITSKGSNSVHVFS